MLEIISIAEGSVSDCGKIAVGDKLISLNGHEINDFLDYRFHQASDTVTARFLNGNGDIFELTFSKEIDRDLGLGFKPDRIIRCRNKCRFCFVNGNAKGMRRSLYIKDDDYRLSFIHGNFITLTNLREQDVERIIEMRLSPLYVSVHTTDDRIRALMFGRPDTPPLLPTMRRLAKAGIQLHSQVVVIPNINDGVVLEKTAKDLAELMPAVRSLAVVPVGLTKYSLCRESANFPLRPVAFALANKLIKMVRKFRRDFGINGNRFAYASDELFLLARQPIPGRSYYDDFPQIENGVGMVRKFLDSIPSRIPRMRKSLFITGYSMNRVWIEKIIPALNGKIKVIAVENRFFGKQVTVTGLLAGNDIIFGLRKLKKQDLIIVLPPNCLNQDDIFIDNMPLIELSARLGMPVMRGSYSLRQTLEMLR